MVCPSGQFIGLVLRLGFIWGKTNRVIKEDIRKVIVKKFWSLRRSMVTSIIRGSARISFSRICLFAFLLLFFVPIPGSVFNLGVAQAAFIWIPSSSNNEFDWSNDQSNKALFGNSAITDNIYQLNIEPFLLTLLAKNVNMGDISDLGTPMLFPQEKILNL